MTERETEIEKKERFWKFSKIWLNFYNLKNPQKKEPWDLAKVEPDPIELNKIPSPWPHYFRIYVHRFFSLIFLTVSTFAATFQYVSTQL